jgi:acylaminoacyl-peptidase
MAGAGEARTQEKRAFEAMDVFQLEYVADPQISPDGQQIVYVRNFMDVLGDRRRSNLWTIRFDGSDHRPLTTGIQNDFSPRWSPDGAKLVYLSTRDGKVNVYLRWMDTGQEMILAHLTQAPSGLTWSPDGEWIAFTMHLPEQRIPFIHMPTKPPGAKWAPDIQYIDALVYRTDQGGYVDPGYDQLFVLPSDGGTPRQITRGPYDSGGHISWTPDGKYLIISANRQDNRESEPLNSDLYQVDVSNGEMVRLTDRYGPDQNPEVSPDGKRIAYTGFDDRLHGYHVSNIYVLDRRSGKVQNLTETLDRSVSAPRWSADNRTIYFTYSDGGNTKIAMVDPSGKATILAHNLGGTSLGRPYGGGGYSVSNNGHFAYTHTLPDHPSDLAVFGLKEQVRRTTHLNSDLFSFVELGAVEEIRYPSSYDGREIQGWYAVPPDFDPGKTYPLILEIHGGPFANYGDRFSAEIQLYASRGYVVLYTNPRGSSSYGKEFGNLIHHNYPGQDYDDLMSGVDAMLEKGFIDSSRLFVTGGSGGGVLTSWIIGTTDRFAAAVVAKPVINWTSFVLHADGTNFFYKYWFPGFPWDYQDQYWLRSPLSRVGNVSTPTMLLTGEADYRTPISESEQFYTALKLRGVETALVRIPEASHGIANRPSHLIAKVLSILKWFERHHSK